MDSLCFYELQCHRRVKLDSRKKKADGGCVIREESQVDDKHLQSFQQLTVMSSSIASIFLRPLSVPVSYAT